LQWQSPLICLVIGLNLILNLIRNQNQPLSLNHDTPDDRDRVVDNRNKGKNMKTFCTHYEYIIPIILEFDNITTSKCPLCEFKEFQELVKLKEIERVFVGLV